MLKNKKIVSIVLVLTIVIYYMLGIFLNNITYATTRNRTTSLDGLTDEKYPGILAQINKLKQSHPNWTFTILYTGLDWNDVIYNETLALHGRSLVQNGNAGWTCSVCGKKTYDNGTWYCASDQAVSYYMDVRNWLEEGYIFAFETLSYNSASQTIDGVKKILSGTFMDKDSITYYDTEGNTQTINKSYAQIIMEAAAESGVSPYHLASRVKQEQGRGGSSLISGDYTYVDGNGNTVTELKGYYNYFNVGAGGTGEQIIKNGLTKAKNSGWTTPELSIKGGANFLAKNYIGSYQDCLYLQKYQVDSAGGLYSYQYMQNISAPYSEGYSMYNAYKNMGMLDYGFNFIVPVYENMPGTISQVPNAVEMESVTENVKITTAYSDLTVRSTPTGGNNLIGSIKKGTVVLRIEKAKSVYSDGRYWDKVAYYSGSNLIIGYAARTDTDGSQYLTQVDDVVTTNEQAVITASAANLRNGPGMSFTNVKKVLEKGTAVTIIDKTTYKVNNYIWYRVKLADGTQGYVSAELVGEKVPDTPDNPDPVDPNPPESKYYKIVDSYAVIAPGTKVSDVSNITYTGEKFTTGSTMTISGKNYTVVVIGDVSGDGEVDARDSARILKYSVNQYQLNDAQKKAADVSKDGEIDARDSARILKYSVNQYQITL